MSKPVNRFPFASGANNGTTNRFGRSSLGGGPSVTNSNARIATMPGRVAPPASPVKPIAAATANLGLNSDRQRAVMVQRLRNQGIQDERVLAAMQNVPRHIFVDEGLASRAYEDAALPIGHGQTISQPWVVARMIAALCEEGIPSRVLEVGAGCGYQAAVLAQLIKEVHAVERIRGLFEMARFHLRTLRLAGRVRLSFGDGMAGLPGSGPFDGIIVAAAGIKIPQALLEQLSVGGRLIAPEGEATQRLVLIERTGPATWKRQELESVRFVPLRPGTQS